MSTGRSSRDSASAKLVERQMRNWELARAQSLSVPAPQREEVEDFISLSRSVGTGGQEVATMLGQRLGWPVFDKEILGMMAGDDDLRRQVYASMDERDLSWYEENLRALMQPEFVKNDYFRCLTKAILSLARQGHGIFLGRGVDLILPQRVGFRVRLEARFETRVENFGKRRGLTPDQARAEVKRFEEEQAGFIRHHFGVDFADPTRYDLVVNLERLTPGQAVEMILSSRQIALGG